jgi:hypothetical protein
MPVALRADFDARSMRVAAKRAEDAAQEISEPPSPAF